MKGKSNRVSRSGKESGVAKATSRAIVLPLADRVIELIESARQKVVFAANLAQVYTYYEIGRQIVEEEQGGSKRAGYGDQVIADLASRLTARFGKGWGERSLRNIRKFYLEYSCDEIRQELIAKSEKKEFGNRFLPNSDRNRIALDANLRTRLDALLDFDANPRSS